MVSLPGIISNVESALELLSLGSSSDNVAIYAGAIGGSSSLIPGVSGIINSILGLSNTSVSAGQLFANARPMKATVRETSRVMEHPAENGVMIADHHIINPVEIDLALLIPIQFYGSTYAQIRQAFVNAVKLTVQTKTGIYPNMIIADMPHEENPDVYDAIVMTMRLKQVLLAPNPVTFQPLQAANSNTVQTGLQNAVGLAQQAVTIASGIASYANLGRFF